jgi:hypothetical protein
MAERIECLRCQTPMEQGFIADATYGGNVQEKWGPGQPHVSFWTGLKTVKEDLIPVTTMRCPRCGALESYARPA